MKERSCVISISALPLEIFVDILSYLDKGSKINSRLVNKSWKTTLDTFFFRFNGTLTDESLSSIQDSAIKFHTITVKELQKQIPLGPGTSLSRSNLAFDPANLVFKQKDVGKRQSEEESVSGENISKLLLYNRNVKSLKFGKNSLQAVPSLKVDGLLMKYLDSLEIKLMEELNDSENVVLLQIGRIKKPALTSLILESTKVALVSNAKDNFTHYSCLFNFIAAHKYTLKSLEFRNFYPMVLQMELSPVSWPALIQVLLSRIREDLNEIKLHSFKLLLPRQEGVFPYILGFYLLSKQDCLSILEVNVPFCGDLSLLYQNVCSAIKRNKSTLTSFSIHRYIVKSNVNEILSVLRALSTCENLQDLQLYLYTIPSFPCRPPSTIKSLTLLGNLEASILVEVKEFLPLLEYLNFSNLASVSGARREEELRNSLKDILRMPKMRKVKWYNEGFSVEFLENEPGVSVRQMDNSHYIFIVYFKM